MIGHFEDDYSIFFMLIELNKVIDISSVSAKNCFQKHH